MAFDSLILWFPPNVTCNKAFLLLRLSFLNNLIAYCIIVKIIDHFLRVPTYVLANPLTLALLIRQNWRSNHWARKFSVSTLHSKERKNDMMQELTIRENCKTSWRSNSLLIDWRETFFGIYLDGKTTKAKSTSMIMRSAFFQHGDKEIGEVCIFFFFFRLIWAKYQESNLVEFTELTHMK